ncbi:MAG: zinc ribbon domain-containing protein [Myxococcota bacterium]
MHFDPARGALSCEHCGHADAVEVPAAEIPEYSISEAMRRPERQGFDRAVKRVRCENCGATVDFDPGNVTARCAFCSASTVAIVEEESRVWRPESLLPFTITREEALAAYRKWLGSLWFRPSDLKKQAKVSELAGVYLPYWTFDAQADSWWTAEAGYYYYVTVSYRDSNGNSRTRQERKVRWEPASGRHYDEYRDVPIYASQGLPVSMCRAIEPYPWENLTPYDPRYLSGFAAEEYVIDAREGWLHGQERMREWERERCAKLVPGDTQRNLRVSTNFSDAKFKHVLLPVWVAAYQYKDEPYRFLVNGQTGKVDGKAPWSWVKIGLATLLVILIILASIYFLGR